MAVTNMGGGKPYPNTAYNDQAYSLSLLATPHPDQQIFSQLGITSGRGRREPWTIYASR